MMAHVRILPAHEVRERAEELWSLYAEVFDETAPFAAWRDEQLLRHASRDRFRLAAAFDGDRVIGFAYGYYGAAGQYYTDSVRDALGPDEAKTWLDGQFEFVEFAVRAAHRRGGIGRELYDAVMAGVDGPALLSTSTDPADPAVRFYTRRGWRRIGAHPRADGSREMQIMGRRP